MIQNVSRLDARLRAVLGLIVLAVSSSFNTRPLLALGAGVLALVLIGTALFRICPLYTLLGAGTNRRSATQ